jgi:Tfp pilus assembly protein PilO
VADVYPDAVSRNPAGEIETVQYHKIEALMLGHVQSQHRRLQAQQADLEAQVAAVATQAATLDELRRATADLASTIAGLERRLTSQRR